MSTLPPQHLDAERGILSACVANSHDHAEVRDTLTAEDFYADANQTMFRTLGEMRDTEKPVDFVSLASELKNRGDLDNVGGVDAVSNLIGFGNHAHLEHYVRLVRDASVARSLARIASEAQRDAMNYAEPASDILERTQAGLAVLAGKMLGDADAVPVSVAVNSLLDQIDRRGRGERPAVTPTGYSELDDLLGGGLRPGHLVILAARPSVGKTSFAVNITRNVCERGEAVLFASLEQSRDELTARMVANISGITGTRLTRDAVSKAEAQRISEAADVVRGWRLEITDRSGLTASQIAATARLAKRRLKGLGLLVVDYLNEVRHDGDKRANRNEQLGTICRRLRECAKTLGIPCLLLAQLNRDATNENEAPKLHHLRDSGEIEQIADVVLMLHREELGGDGKPERIRVIVRKQRNGAIGGVLLDHDAPRYRFTEADFD